MKLLKKNNFVETKSIKWIPEIVIPVEEGTYIKNIRMVNQGGVLTNIEIYQEDQKIDDLFVLAFPVYKYINDIKKGDNILPFSKNISGIYKPIKIIANSLNEKTCVEGILRYDVYKIKNEMDTKTFLSSHLYNSQVTGVVKYIIKHDYKEESHENFSDKISEDFWIHNHNFPEIKFIRKDSKNIFRIYKPLIDVNDYTVPKDVIIIM